MRVTVKLLGFVFWLFFFNCAQSQECKRANITQKNTEPAAKESYNDGETVKLTCTTGFTGMYRLKCEKGEWKASIERPCAKKKCSHPGDTANGDFSLIAGSEFVFGATVLYTCKKGFEMTSRINQRTCRAQGWDNTLPVCEAVTCPAIYTDEGVTASGNTEEGSYGDVIHFECVSNDKKIDGSSDIHCTETGEWSASVPKCKAITCTAPDISNGYVVEKMQEYQKDAILKYRCSTGFKPREGIPRCAKFGWTLNPECDEVTCELKSTTFGVKKIKPEGKTIFRAGERVEITCTEKHWFYGTKENIKSFTCGENGKWDSDPVCAEIRCEVPHDQHVYNLYYYFSGDKKLGVKKYYYCVSGYDQMSSEATCTRDGWTPNPLCAVTCAAPNIPNAEIVGDRRTKYIINSRIQYKCHPGFEPEQPVEITCIYQSEWTGIRQCTANQKSCRDLSVENGLIHSYSSNEEEIFYTCNTGYKPFTGNWWDSATCSKGSWTEEPRCIREEECGAFPSVHHGKVKQTKKTFHDRDTTAFECDPGFISTPRFITCVNGTWEKPVCEVGVRCDIPPKVENVLITSKPEEYYVDGSSVTYACRRLFLMNGKSTVFCRNGTWEKMGTCEEVTCELKSTTFGAKNIKPENKTIFRAGERVEINCTEKGMLHGTNEVIQSFTCGENGQWDYDPVCAEIRCEVPRDQHVSDPYYYFSGDEKLGVKRSYYCISGYDKMSPEATCTRDGWTPKPLCEIRCEVPRDQHVSDPYYYFSGDKKLGVKKSYYCISGYDKMSSVATCTRDGWTPNPLCADIRCEVPRDPHVYDLYAYFRGDEKLGVKIYYHCISGYDKMSSEATCTRDGWTPNPLCEIRCEVPHDQHVYDLYYYFSGDLKLGTKRSYDCISGYNKMSSEATCTRDGWTPNPLCAGQ